MVSEILDNTGSIISAIREQTNLSEQEIMERIKKKQEQYGGLLNEGGAAYSLAKDLDVTTGFEPKPTQIKDLNIEMNNVRLVAQVQQVFPLNEFAKPNARGCVQNLVVKDNTGSCRLVLWNKRDFNVKENDMLIIENAYIKDNNGNLEVHIGNYGKVTISEAPEEKEPEVETIEIKQTTAVPKPAPVQHAPQPVQLQQATIPQPEPSVIESMKENDVVSFDGKITRSFPVYDFSRSSGVKGRVRSAEITDGTAKTRFVFWNDKVELLNNFRDGQDISVKNAKVRDNKGNLELHFVKGTEITSK